MKNSKLKGKKILITGVSGFVGSHLQKKLEGLGAIVYGVSLHRRHKLNSQADILEYKQIDTLVMDKEIDILYHLAGESLVESGRENPYSTFRVNIDGTLNVLEIARKRGLERIIIASSSHVYGKNEVPYLESYTPKPSRPYETSKACTDLIAQSYADTYRLPVLIPRFVNIYGPGDLNFTRLIPKTMKQILFDNKVELWGGNAIRDFLYIDDAVDAYTDLGLVDIKTIEENRIFNFGGGNAISVRDIVEKIIKVSKKDIKITKIEEEREDEIKSQYVSLAKARRHLGWEPKIPLTDGLQKTFEWYQQHLSL